MARVVHMPYRAIFVRFSHSQEIGICNLARGGQCIQVMRLLANPPPSIRSPVSSYGVSPPQRVLNGHQQINRFPMGVIHQALTIKSYSFSDNDVTPRAMAGQRGGDTSLVAVLNALSPKNTPMCDSISTAHCRSHSHFKLATQEAGSSRCFSPNTINSYSLVTKMFSNPTHCYRF